MTATVNCVLSVLYIDLCHIYETNIGTVSNDRKGDATNLHRLIYISRTC